MDKNKTTVTMKLKDVVRVVMMLEDAVDVSVSSINMFGAQRDAYSKDGSYDSAEGKVTLKNIEDGLKILKSKTICRQFFLKDLKKRINDTGIDIDTEIEKYKEGHAGK